MMKPVRTSSTTIVRRIVGCGLVLGITLGAAARGTESSVEVPPGWSETVHHELNGTMRALVSPGDPKRASVLALFELTAPIASLDLSALATNVLAPFNLSVVEERSVQPIAGVEYREFSATQGGGPRHDVTVIALQERDRQQVVFFGALPEEYRRVGGADFALERLTRFRSVAELRAAQVARSDAIGRDRPETLAENRAGIALTHEDFALLVETVELLSGVQMRATEIGAFKRDLVTAWRADDTETDMVSALRAQVEELRSLPLRKQLKAIERWYVNAWLAEKREGEVSPLMDAVYELNPVLAQHGDLVLSERALEARLRSAELYLRWRGDGDARIERALADSRRRIPRAFGTMEPQEREDLIDAHSRWFGAWVWGANASLEERADMVEKVGTAANGNSDPSLLGRTLEAHLAEQVHDFNSYIQAIEQMVFAAVVLPEFRTNSP